MATKPKITHGVARSLEEVPEELRPVAEKMFKEGTENKGPVVHQSFSVTVRNRDGSTTVYNSLDEMPPQMRVRYEEAIQRAKRNQSSS